MLCLGMVYLSELAKVMNTQESHLSHIARKYDSEFDVHTDGNGNRNIGLGQRSGGGGGGKRESYSDTSLSRMLASLLRHRAEDQGFNFMEGKKRSNKKE